MLFRFLKWLLTGVVGIVVMSLIAGRVYQEISESRDLERYSPPGEMVDVDGHLMHINCIGKGSRSAGCLALTQRFDITSITSFLPIFLRQPKKTM